MHQPSSLTLINLQNGDLAFKIQKFEDGSYFDHVQRNGYYSLIWVREGEGQVRADFTEYDFKAENLFAFAPYQPFMFSSKQMKGVAVYFHPDFFCIHKHKSDAPCLFNNIYQRPHTVIDGPTSASLEVLLKTMQAELTQPVIDQHEVLVSYLKVFLITVSRQKMAQSDSAAPSNNEPVIIQALTDTIERDFRKKHSASDYADTLNMSTKALAKITKGHFNRTITDMISARIIIEAKRELYMSRKSIKEIAYSLGYDDEYYFSRFFKSNVALSPQLYRETIGWSIKVCPSH
jgi:AraC family transcriptional regulator, transcriptional activator of pobA